MQEIIEELVRDKVPQRYEKQGQYVLAHKLNDENFKEKLGDRIVKLSLEVVNLKDKDELKDELSDLLEFILKLMEINNVNQEEVFETMLKKKEMMGGFDERIYLIKVVDQQYVDENKGCLLCCNPTCRVPYREKLGVDENGKPMGYNCIGYESVYKKKI